ncbi:MAG: DEAD/DEAH box helicase family protein [Bacteroidaceae bacterium]|nr:DEAD/DEAH box helicase family protein [Bacteroidaceae bacterium]
MNKTLLDNSDGYKIVVALQECISNPEVNNIRIATGYWDLPGMSLIIDQLKQFFFRPNAKMRLLIGKDPYVYARILKSPKYVGTNYPDDFIRTDIDSLAENLKAEYKEVVKLLLTYCSGSSPQLEIHVFRTNEADESQFLHSKCYIMTCSDNVQKAMHSIIGSSNFTEKGLQGNAELNTLENDPYFIASVNEGQKAPIRWFEEKWRLSEDWTKVFFEQVLRTSRTFEKMKEEGDISGNVSAEEITPYELYIKLLQTKFGDLVDKNLDEVIESYLPDGFDKYSYQIDAVKQCFSTMKEHGGFMLADVVGLGKTIVGSLVIKHFLQFPDDDGRERKVLIITPPAIKSAWVDTIKLFDKDATDKMEDYIDYITTGSIGKLVDEVEGNSNGDDDNSDSGDFEGELQNENYGLIIIDESHKFRNSGTNMYEALDNLISQIGADTGAYPYIGLLSATPQNNRPDDLKNQIYLFERNHADTTLTKANSGNLENFFSEINAEYSSIIHPADDDPSTPEERRERLKQLSRRIRDCVLADVMVRRTRTDVQMYYADDMERQHLKFPKIEGPNELEYQMGSQLSHLFAETMDIIAPTEEYKLKSNRYLSYYRYRAIQFLADEANKRKYDARGSRDADKLADQLANIMQINLVKRLESSFSAFYQSLLNLRQYTRNMIDMWESGNIFICPQINVNAELDRKAKEQKRKRSVSYKECLDDIRAKIIKLNEDGRNEDERNMEYTISDMRPEYIDLLRADYDLISELCDRWAKNTEDPKLDVFKDNLKYVLFDKDKNIPQKLVVFSEAIDTVDTIKSVAESKGYRVLKITAGNRNEMEQTIRENFDANYGKKPGEVQKNDFDIIVTTEVLAEGINLHRANVILNYDTPWNSTRLMQRIGRVNRIGSTQDKVYVYNFKPSAEGDAEINLVEKAYTKLQSFHTLFGEDSKVYTIDEEVSHYDLNTVVNGEESPLEKYIYELKQYKEAHPERYDYILNRNENLECATRTVDGNCYFLVRTPRMSGLFVKVSPVDSKGRIISASEMYESFSVPQDAPLVELPEHWEEDKKKAEKAVNQHLHKMNVRMGSSTKATKAKEILRRMQQNIAMSMESKALLADAFTLVNKGNSDIIKKVLAFGEALSCSNGDLFGGLTQQDFDSMIEREIRNIVANLQQRYGKAEVFIGLSK